MIDEDDKIYDEEDNFLAESLCVSCYHYIVREIKPLQSNIDEWAKIANCDITDDTILETHACLLLQVALDHLVLKCNKYIQTDSAEFIKNVEKHL